MIAYKLQLINDTMIKCINVYISLKYDLFNTLIKPYLRPYLKPYFEPYLRPYLGPYLGPPN